MTFVVKLKCFSFTSKCFEIMNHFSDIVSIKPQTINHHQVKNTIMTKFD